MAAKIAAKIFNFNLDGLKSRLITIFMLIWISRAAKPFLKLVLQSGHQKPKWPLKYLTFNLDGRKEGRNIFI